MACVGPHGRKPADTRLRLRHHGTHPTSVFFSAALERTAGIPRPDYSAHSRPLSFGPLCGPDRFARVRNDRDCSAAVRPGGEAGRRTGEIPDMRVYHLSSLSLPGVDTRSRLYRSLTLVRERHRNVRAADLSDAMLKEWTAEDMTQCLPEVTAARYAAPILFAFTPPDYLIPVKVFVYAYEHYCRSNHGQGNWLDEWAELRFVQFQYLLRLVRLARDTGEPFPSFNLFDFCDYDRLVDEAASIDPEGRLHNMLAALPLRIDCYENPC